MLDALAHLQRWTPLVLQYIEANSTQLIDVRMVDACEEPHLGGRHRILLRQKQFELEDAL